MNVASWITLSRIFLLPLAVLPLVLGWGDGWLISAVVVGIAGITDMLDGYLARRRATITALGRNLDLVADKVFVCGMALALAWKGVLAPWIPAAIIVREAAVSSVRIGRFGARPPPPDRLGKVKTAVSMVALVWLVAATGFPGSSFATLGQWAMYLAVALTVVSGVNYLVRYNGHSEGTAKLKDLSP